MLWTVRRISNNKTYGFKNWSGAYTQAKIWNGLPLRLIKAKIDSIDYVVSEDAIDYTNRYMS